MVDRGWTCEGATSVPECSSGADVTYVALDELPGGMPVAIVETDHDVVIYISRAYSMDEVAQALTVAVGQYVKAYWVYMEALAARL